MAEKNQFSLANGAPPQFMPANQTSSYGSLGQAQITQTSGMQQMTNPDHLQNPQVSLVNGQVTPNSRSPHWPQQPGHSMKNISGNGEGDSVHQQPSTVSFAQTVPLQMTKNVLSYPGNPNVKTSQSVYTSLNQANTAPSMISQSNSVTPPSMVTQGSPNLQSTTPNVFRPSPLAGNKLNVPTSGVSQPAWPSGGPAPQPQMYQQVNKVRPPPVSQYSGTPTGPFPSPQINKPMYGPPSATSLPSKSSPFNKPLVPNASSSQCLPPPVSQEMSLSSQNQNLNRGSHLMTQASRPQYPNVSQSFLPVNSQLSSSQSGPPGLPQGYQPPPLANNQIPRKTSLSNTSLPGENQPVNNYLNSEQGTPTYHNRYAANKDLGPPPMGGVPPPSTVPRQQTNRLPSHTSGYRSLGHPENSLSQSMSRMSVTQQGFNKLWGVETVDLLQCRNILPPQKVTPPPIRLHQEFMDNVNCSPEIFCCTLNKIPETNSLLQKSRLPLGILIHPFRDLSQLAVIQCSSIVRCRACRTYINPFVYFVDNKRWKCNLCFRVNELPDEFQYDPVTKTYGDPSRRPEIRSSTIEFIAPSEYMLRPPQPAIYLFVLDVSRWGCDSGYLETFCSILLEELDNIPGDSRTQIGFILFDSTIHFFSIAENYNQAHEMIVTDIDDVFLPTPDSLLVNLNENRQLIKDLLEEIPRKYAESFDTDSALGPALQAAYKLMSPTGGRITVFQSCLPNKGPGALGPREDPNQRSSKDVRHLGPQTDFYKRLSLDCSTQQISVDLFLVSSQYSDLATLGGISQFSGGCVYHFPLFRRIDPESNERLSRALRRYLTRKIGFEAVMRVRCSRGLSIHTFHGNFFVRSTDLLSLPNVNPDAGFGMQIAIEDSLFELQCVCFQAAVLYTSAKGERRIRVHTLCLPVSSNLSDILTSADQQAIVGLLGKMAVDRSLKSNLADAREAFINVAIDILSAYKLVETSGGQNTILAPLNLSLIPLYILALLKSTAFRTGQNTRLDDRVYAMSQMKTLPLRELIQLIHPDLYHVTQLDDNTGVEFEDKLVAQPARLSLSSEHLDSRGAFLLDTPEVIYILLGKNISPEYLGNIFGVGDIRQINKDLVDLPDLENEESEKLRHFVSFLQADKPWPAVVRIVTEPNLLAPFFINDKSENALSYYELLHHVKAQLK